MKTLKIFISSPGDVAEERTLARRVVERLQGEYGSRGVLEPVFWEHEPLRATASWHDQILSPAKADIVICILWARLGTRQPAEITRPDGSRYNSGTEFEFEEAWRSYQERQHPDLLVYRKTKEPRVSLKDKADLLERVEQKESLDRFMDTWFQNREEGTLIAAFHPFESSGDFEELFEVHLRKLIEQCLPEAGSGGETRIKTWTAGSPFRGLNTFEFDHSPIFFGRTKAMSEVLEALRVQADQGRAFVLVLGMSGCGKSSLVRAGVLPLLTQPAVIEGVGLWRWAVMRPGDAGASPFAALAKALLDKEALPELGADGTGVKELTVLLRESPEAAFALLKGGLSQAASALARAEDLERQPEARMALVVDQLEELFTATAISADERQRFAEALRSLATSGKVWVLATLRSDFYHRCAEIPTLVSLKEGNGQYDLLPPSPAEIGQMIRRPALLAGLDFEENEATGERLDDLLRDAASGNPEALPLLQFTLEELYKTRTENGVLTLAAYEDLGGVEGALARRAEAEYRALPEPVQDSLPVVMSSLVTVGSGVGDGGTRHRAPIEIFPEGTPGRTVVDHFIAARLFVTDRDDRGRAVVSVAHEALLEHWPRLAEWLTHNRELLRVRERLDTAAAQWEAEGRPASSLLASQKRLAEAEELETSDAIELPEREHLFLQASLARGRRMEWLKRSAVAALVVLAVAAGVGAWFANQERAEAEVARGEAEAVTSFLSDTLASVDPEELGRDVLVKDVLDKAVERIDELENQPMIQSRLMMTIGTVSSDLGEWDQAEELLTRSVGIRESELGPDHLRVSHALNNLGALYSEKGEFEMARPILERALAIRQELLPSNDPLVASTLTNLANVFYRRGDFEAAREHQERAIEAYEQADEMDHDGLSKVLGNSGVTLVKLGDLERARERYERSIEVSVAGFGPNHPSASGAMSNLGSLLRDTGKREKAQDLLERVVAIDKKAWGPDHPQFSESLRALAIFHAMGADFDQAKPMFERILAISEKTFGPESFAAGGAVMNLAVLNAQTGNFEQARELFERGMAINEKLLGPNHVSVANDLNNLGNLNVDMGNFEEARPLYQRALAIREQALGPDAPDVAISLHDLGVLLLKTKSFVEAKPLFERALAIREKALGPDHPGIALSMVGLARVMTNTGRPIESETMLERALSVQKKKLGPDHPEVADTLVAMAELCLIKRDYVGGEAHILRALEIFEEKLGPAHSYVADALDVYIELLRESGRTREAVPLEDRVAAIRQVRA